MISQMARGLGMVLAKRCSLSAVRRRRLLVANCPALASHQMTRSYVLDNGPKVKSDHRSGTMVDVARTIREQSGVDVGYHTIPKPRDHLLQHEPKREELPPRTMLDSHTTAILPLSASELIRESYVNHLGRVRLGRIMEELDMFAVWICHRHVKLPKLPKGVPLPYTFVTLLVDKVEFTNLERLQVNQDIEISGHISWAGRSSMEITIYVRQLIPGSREYIDVTKAIFVMVARNATNTAAAPINPLEVGNETEKLIWEQAEKRQKLRKSTAMESVLSSPPREYEQTIMYEILKRTTPTNSMDLNKRVLPPKCRWMEDSLQSTMIAPFPENRNAQNTIFGGYLMRQAVEISFIMASIYLGDRPILTCISDISFMHPVHVNRFLQLTAYVVYAAQNYVQLMTVAQIWDAKSGKVQTTNVFYLTYRADKVLDEVLPRSYREMLWYIHGRRKLLAALHLQPELPDPIDVPTESSRNICT
ncbi:acyl-coenzyme A thioesterase 9, mitochondrial [Drosophila subpulchrella]|uniref:acyl-coenzyme A thioesterase 9, mitochondrial n=1 Tax=Drosophila subpulchrella TaxID=1486046 RepID=UPI0018A1748F|nr:acyl-coenzyme A thioesterase 9, mitochondrial [Drosophila subpulchrella]